MSRCLRGGAQNRQRSRSEINVHACPGYGSPSRTIVHLSVTSDSRDSLKDMQRTAIALTGVLAVLLMTATASAARGRPVAPAKCRPNSSHVLFTDPQAEVYAVPNGEVLNIRACANGQRRSFFIASCNRRESAATCAEVPRVTLAGAAVAYEEFFTTADRYTLEGAAVRTSLRVIVRDLRTGRVLHDVPTGTPPKPEPGSVGVGEIVALVLKSDGSVAWIAEDTERSATAKAPYFDVYAADGSGTRLLASGTDVDPSSLALSVDATHLDYYPHTIAGSTLYWTQGGQSFSTTLN